MGNSCVTAKQKNKHNPESACGDCIPQGIEDLRRDKDNLPQLNFELSISDIQLRKAPDRSAGLRVTIEGLLDWQYSTTNSVNLTWKEKRKMIIKATEYEFSKMFIIFRVVDKDGREIGCLPLNMFLILTGPWRHDFKIKYEKGKDVQASFGRLSADIKCTQTIELQMQTIKAQVNFVNEHPGEMFHFTLKTEDLVGNSDMTSESYDVQTFLYNKKRSYENQSQGQSATWNNKKRKSIILEHYKGLQWSSSVSKRSYQKQLPMFRIPLKVDVISNYSFHFILWKKSEDDDQTFQSYGETNIPMAKLFWTDVKGGDLNPQVGATREIQIQQNVQFMGKRCGIMEIRCRVTTPKFFQQVLVLTRTQFGITQSGRETLTSSLLQVSECQYFKKMRNIKQSMLKNMLKSGNLKNQYSEKGLRQYREHKNSIYQDILRFERLFSQGSGTPPCFDYSSEQKLMKAQNQMIDIIQKIIPLTQLRQMCISEAVWRCLRTLLFRGQFLLSKIGFTENELSALSSQQPKSKLKKSLQQKINLCQTYQATLIKLLNFGLSRFGRKLLDQEFKFVVSISTVSYFKIKQFREQLLGSVLNIHDKSQRTYCYENSYKKQNFLNLVDWETRFNIPLEKFGANKIIIQEIKQPHKWKQIVGKRSSYFFSMIEDWATNLKTVIGWPDAIKCWSAVPGYNILVGSFLREMEIRRIQQYPDVMKDANMSLLQNQCLLPIFTKILLEKTNTYQIGSTLKSLELISAYFAHFQYNKQILPSCFDSKLFYVAIKAVMVSKNCFTISKLLQILYMYFNIFSNQFKKQVSLLFLGRYFFNLMLNWGRGVRTMFKYLLLYRILLWGKEKDKQIPEINSRWGELKILLVQAELAFKKSKSKKQQKETASLSYHQKMKFKLSIKKVKFLEDVILDRKIKSEGYTYLKTEESAGTTEIMNSPMCNDQYSLNFEKSSRKQKFSEDIELKSIQDIGMRRSSDPTPKKGVRNRRVSFFNDFQIATISPDQEPYLEICKSEMTKFEDEYRIWMKTTRNLEDVPRVDIQVPIDGGDMRPESMEV